jgi:hypothetical protein
MTQNIQAQKEKAGVELDFTSPEQCGMALSMAAVALSEKLSAQDVAQTLKTDKQAIEDGIVDVMVALLCLGDACDIDLDQAFERRCMLEEESCCEDEDCSDESCCCSAEESKD